MRIAAVLCLLLVGASCALGDDTAQGQVEVVAVSASAPAHESNSTEPDSKYLIGLLNTPSNAPIPEGSRTVRMTAKNGQQYQCVIPDGKVATKVAEKSLEERIREVGDKIQGAFGKGCFTKSLGYWTYEVCPFQKIRQYHKEGDRITSEFNLGIHDPLPEVEASKTGLYTQSYESGTGGRKSTVRYICTEDPADKPVLQSISEPQSHQYEFEIRTHLACLAPQGESTVEALLLPLQHDCALLNTGWWTYKFCYQRGVTQFHRENGATADGQPTQGAITAEFDLGHQVTSSTVDIVKGETPALSYASQWYTGGTKCDIGDMLPRKTEVRFYCDPLESQAIRAIKETSTCEYLMTIGTRYLCSHKVFAPPQSKVHEIACSPLSLALDPVV